MNMCRFRQCICDLRYRCSMGAGYITLLSHVVEELEHCGYTRCMTPTLRLHQSYQLHFCMFPFQFDIICKTETGNVVVFDLRPLSHTQWEHRHGFCTRRGINYEFLSLSSQWTYNRRRLLLALYSPVYHSQYSRGFLENCPQRICNAGCICVAADRPHSRILPLSYDYDTQSYSESEPEIDFEEDEIMSTFD